MALFMEMVPQKDMHACDLYLSAHQLLVGWVAFLS
jgi:hypothetical protein